MITRDRLNSVTLVLLIAALVFWGYWIRIWKRLVQIIFL